MSPVLVQTCKIISVFLVRTGIRLSAVTQFPFRKAARFPICSILPVCRQSPGKTCRCSWGRSLFFPYANAQHSATGTFPQGAPHHQLPLFSYAEYYPFLLPLSMEYVRDFDKRYGAGYNPAIVIVSKEAYGMRTISSKTFITGITCFCQ